MDKHGTKVRTVRYSPVNLVGKDSTKSVYSTISSLLSITVTGPSENLNFVEKGPFCRRVCIAGK